MQRHNRWTRRRFVQGAGAAAAAQAGGIIATGSGSAAPLATSRAFSAPTLLQNLTEWNVVTSLATGGADPLSEYPSNAQYFLPWHVMEPLFYPALAEDGRSWTLVNELARGWEFSDPQTLVVALEEGVLFQNGEELTAEHVKVAFDTILATDPPIRRAAPLRPLGEAEVVDQYTIQWHMPAPNLSVLGAMYQLIIPPLARQEMTAEEFEAEPSGTGPYRVVSWPRDGVVELEAWSEYRRGPVTPQRIVGREVPDPSTRLFELISGSAQVAQGLTVEAIPELEGSSEYELTSLRGQSLIAEVINIYKSDPPLSDSRIRRAINHAINREAIVEAILEGQAVTLPGPLAPGWLGHAPEHEPFPYDPDMARQLLDEAGVSDLTFSWNLAPGPHKNLEVAQAAASQLAEVGITVNIQQMETARLLSDRNEGNYDVVSLNFGCTWVPATLFQFTLNTSLSDERLVPQWGDTPDTLVQARELYADASATTEFAVMEERLREVHQHMHDEAFWLYVYCADELWGVDRSTGFRPFPTVYYRWYDEWARRGMTPPEDPRIPLVLS